MGTRAEGAGLPSNARPLPRRRLIPRYTCLVLLVCSPLDSLSLSLSWILCPYSRDPTPRLASSVTVAAMRAGAGMRPIYLSRWLSGLMLGM